MAGKNKKQAPKKGPSTGDALRAEVERSIQKGQFKEAVKQAKICLKDDASEANHRLLERAYLLRAQQLYKGGMPTSAIEVAGHLLEHGVSDLALVEDAVKLFLALGMSKAAQALQGRIESPEAQARLVAMAADQAVLHPERNAGALPEIKGGAATVRAALEALEAGDEAKALEMLREISRGSPFADWRLFTRGLAAFYREDLEDARANWGRLDPDRAAVRIARWLQGPGAAEAKGSGSAAPVVDVAAVERQVFGEPVLKPLQTVRDLVAEGRWPEAIRELGPIRHALRRVQPELALRLTRILVFPLIHETTSLDFRGAMKLIEGFTRNAEPLPIDPRWNRLMAKVWEGPQGGTEEAERYWLTYIDDLKSLPSLSVEERSLAQALVWLHIAAVYRDDAYYLEDSGGDEDSDPDDLDYCKERAIECLEQSLKLAPKHLPTHEALFHAKKTWGTHKQAEAVARRLLEAFPDHFETLVDLATQLMTTDRPGEAIEFAKRARALKPLDPTMVVLEFMVRVASAREHALNGRFSEGRAEFDEAARVAVEKSSDYAFLAKRALLEMKAGDRERSESLLREAQGSLADPTPLWLALVIESHRFQLPKELGQRYTGLFDEGLKKKALADSGGKMAGLLLSYLASNIDYPGRAAHVAKVREYLHKTTRLKFQKESLLLACLFLERYPEELETLQKLDRKGLKDFPDVPYFHLLAATNELALGPRKANLRTARKHAEKALEVAQASADRKDKSLLPQIKETLNKIIGLSTNPFMRFGRRGAGGGPFRDIFEEMFEEGGIDPEEFFREAFGGKGRPGPMPKPKSKKS